MTKKKGLFPKIGLIEYLFVDTFGDEEERSNGEDRRERQRGEYGEGHLTLRAIWEVIYI